MKIYAICDFELLNKNSISLTKYIETCKNLNVEIIQYRDKNSKIEDIKKRLIELRNLWPDTLIINDYIELIKYCDGLHIGQEDLEKYPSVEKIREIIGNKILGLSTHNKEEIIIANKLDINYIGLGAYRITNTKTDISTIIGENLPNIAKLSNHDVVAIGGIKLDDKINNVQYLAIGNDIIRQCK
jgi:thiamine-phosphate pyrophosphorylase